MKYKCCNLIQHGLCFFENDLVSCCFSPNDQVNGGHPPVIISPYKGESLSKEELFQKINDYVAIFKKGGCPKECLNCYHLEEKEWDETPFINSVTITHFSNCNANCIYCSNNLEQSERTNDTYEILPVLRSLKEQGIIKQGVELHIGGGEFTIYKECNQLLDEFALSGFAKVYIPTNAIKFSQELNSAIKKGAACIIVSLDSGSKKTYKKIKRVDAFDIVVNNLKIYASNGVNQGEIALKYIVIPTINDNFGEFKKFLNIASEIGVKNIIIDLDAKYARELKHKVDSTLICLVQKFEKYSHKQGFSTETYSFFSQCLNTSKVKKNILFQLYDLLKYRYFNQTANNIYRNSVKMQKKC